MRLHILIASAVSRRREGGAAGVIENTALVLRARGHEVRTLYREDLLPNSAHSHRLDGLVFSIRVAAYILRHRAEFSVVNIHAPSGFLYGLLRTLPGFSGAPPYVVTMHALEARRSHAMRREALKGRTKGFSLTNRIWHNIYHRSLYRIANVTADYGMILNREAWSYVLLRYDRDPQRFWHVPNGVEDRFFLCREYPAAIPPRILFVGTWLEQRGTYYLAEALERLAEKLVDLQMTLAGTSVPFENVASAFHPSLHRRLRVLPFVPGAEMTRIYLAHDIFVFPSLMEGTPLTLLEAMASGMPVVTTETCGMTDVVRDRVNGLLVPPANSSALASAIYELSTCGDMRRELGMAAQQSMRALTWHRIAPRIEYVHKLAAGCAPDGCESEGSAGA